MLLLVPLLTLVPTLYSLACVVLLLDGAPPDYYCIDADDEGDGCGPTKKYSGGEGSTHAPPMSGGCDAMVVSYV